MINPNWKTDGLPTIVSDKQITVTLPSGQPKSVRLDDDAVKFHDVLNAIRERDWESVPILIDATAAVEMHFKDQFDVRNDHVYIDDIKLPVSLSNRILSFAKNRLPVEPLLKFWDNLNMNPSFRSVQQLHSFLEANDHPITEDGWFIAYRSVTSEFKDKHTGTMDNSPGKTVSMMRNQVDENPDQTCSHGLHVANYKYASEFGSGSDKLILVKVHPRDVVAVPNDYNRAKMRVCSFFVIQEIAEEVPNTPLYSDSEGVDEDDDEHEEDLELENPDMFDDLDDEDEDLDDEDEDEDSPESEDFDEPY